MHLFGNPYWWWRWGAWPWLWHLHLHHPWVLHGLLLSLCPRGTHLWCSHRTLLVQEWHDPSWESLRNVGWFSVVVELWRHRRNGLSHSGKQPLGNGCKKVAESKITVFPDPPPWGRRHFGVEDDKRRRYRKSHTQHWADWPRIWLPCLIRTTNMSCFMQTSISILYKFPKLWRIGH